MVVRVARDLSLYGYGFLVALVAFRWASAWWWIGVLVLALVWISLESAVRRADERKGFDKGYGEGWDKGHQYGYDDGHFVGYGKGFNDALAMQKKATS